MLLLRVADHLIAEHDPDLSIARGPLHRLEPRLLGRVRVDAGDVALETTHEEEQSEDRERPYGQDHEKDRLVASHIRQFVRA